MPEDNARIHGLRVDEMPQLMGMWEIVRRKED
jgi:hypothetical protein